MTSAMILAELNAIGPDELDPFPLGELYKRAIPHGVEREIGVYPVQDRLWKPCERETVQANTDRFVRDVLEKHYQGDRALYSNRKRIGRFLMEGSKKAIKLYSISSIGFHICTSDTREILAILHLALTGSVPEWKDLDAESDRLNGDKIRFANENTFNETIAIGPYSIKLRLFKNYWIEVRGLTSDQVDALGRVKELADRPL